MTLPAERVFLGPMILSTKPVVAVMVAQPSEAPSKTLALDDKSKTLSSKGLGFRVYVP